MPSVSDSGRPSGKYADRMLKGAWPATPQSAIDSEQQKWRRLRDEARNTYHDGLENNRQLRESLQSKGFEALHQDRDLVTRNWDFLAETRHDAMQLFRRASEARDLLRQSMASTVYQREQEIALVEENPLIKDADKKEFVDALIEATNAELIEQSAAAGAALTAAATQHLTYLASLPWHMLTADSATSPVTPRSNGVQAMNAGWKQNPATGTGGTESGGQTGGRGTGGENTPDQTSSQQQQTGRGTDGDRSPRQDPTTGQQPGRGTDGRPTPKQGSSPTPQPVRGTDGIATPAQKPALTLPPIGGGTPSLGGGPGGGGGLTGLGGGGAGGLRMPGSFAGPPQGLLPSQLAGASPLSASNPLSSVTPAASGLSGGGAGMPKASVPLPMQAPVPPAAAAPPAANAVASPATASPSVQPAGLSPATPAPIAQAPAAGAPAVSGPLGPAPPLSAPPPSAGAPPVGPVAPPAPPPGVGGPGPFHAPLPPVGTPIVRRGLIQVAEDPDLIRARQLIWELMWAGRRYPSLDWAVGLHRGQGGATKFFLTSSEGEGYIPQHVFLPADPALVPLFLDVDFVQRGWRETWQGWVDPARIVVEHHRLRAEAFGRPVLYAVVSSREITGLGHLLPQGVKLEVAAAEDNPFIDPEKARDVPTGVPAGRAHRLAVLHPGLWSLVQRMPKSQKWSAAVDLAADAAARTDERHVRTGLIVRDAAPMDAVDPHGPLLHGVLNHLRDGNKIATETWQQLQTAYFTHLMQSQSRRHSGSDLTDDTGYVDAYRRARAYEAAWLLDAPEGPLTPEWLADVAYSHLCATDDGYRTGQLMAERAA